MRRINKAQDGAAQTELDTVAIVERRRAGDALIVNQRAVEAAQVNEHVLAVLALNFRMATRDDGCRSIKRHFHVWLAPEPRHILR